MLQIVHAQAWNVDRQIPLCKDSIMSVYLCRGLLFRFRTYRPSCDESGGGVLSLWRHHCKPAAITRSWHLVAPGGNTWQSAGACYGSGQFAVWRLRGLCVETGQNHGYLNPNPSAQLNSTSGLFSLSSTNSHKNKKTKKPTFQQTPNNKLHINHHG